MFTPRVYSRGRIRVKPRIRGERLEAAGRGVAECCAFDYTDRASSVTMRMSITFLIGFPQTVADRL